MNTDLYHRNLSAIGRKDESLLRWIESAQPVPGVDLIQVNDGAVDLLVRNESGTQVRYYGRRPSIEAEHGGVQGLELQDGSMTCLVGMGLGFTAKAMLEKKAESHHVAVLEPHPWIVRLALHLADFSEPMERGTFHLLRPESKNAEDLFLQLLSSGVLYEEVRIIADPRSTAISKGYKAWERGLLQAYQYALRLIGSSTVVRSGSIENEIENTALVSLCLGPEELKEVIHGKPVLIVSAGPSLDHSIQRIREAGEKMYVFAFSAAWRTLLAHGINPDLILTSDKNTESLRMLRSTRFAQDIPLAFSSSSCPEFVRSYLGPRIAVPQNALFPLMPSHGNHIVSLGTGPSVAVFAFHLAVYLEADPVAFIGLDLAVDRVTHASGHYGRGEFNPDDPRLREVQGLGGKRVRTFDYLEDIRSHLESCIGLSHVKPVNATLSGARIDGAVEMDLREVLESIPILSKDRRSRLEPRLDRDLPTRAIRDLVDSLRSVTGIAAKGIRVITRLENAREEDPLRQTLASELNEIGQAMQTFLASHPLLNEYLSHIWLKLKQETRKSMRIQGKAERLKSEMQKNLDALRAIRSEAEKLRRLTIRIEKGLLRRERKEDPDEGFFLFMLENGFYREALSWCEKEGQGTPDYLMNLAAVKLRMGFLSEALRLVEKGRGDKERKKARRAMEDQIRQERKSLVDAATEALRSGSRIDGILMSRELARALSDDPEAMELVGRLAGS
jgi:hypothetical protein